jgi:hypothetical protein
MLVDSGWRGLEGLKIVCGGEALPIALADVLLEKGDSLWHMYGPTETTVWSAIHPLEPGTGSPPIGGPIANTRFYVLDERRQIVPIGIPGELYIGGDGLARGYRNRPELSAEKFPADVVVDGQQQRLYATGDLVRVHADGTLEFLGRIDHQIKLRGFRIELGEIEAQLSDNPEVRNAAVIVREDTNTPGDQRLVAYVVPAEGCAPSVADLRAPLAERLPGYMIPAAFVLLDALPVTANRKLDRAALPAPDVTRPELRSVYTHPRTPVEGIVASTWGDVLGMERVGIDDGFFELGGNSLLAMRVAARLSERLGVQVALRSMFELPTVREQARLSVRALTEASLDEDEISRLLEELEESEVSS